MKTSQPLKRTGPLGVWEKDFHPEEMANAKVLRQAPACVRSSKKAGLAAVGEGGNRSKGSTGKPGRVFLLFF